MANKWLQQTEGFVIRMVTVQSEVCPKSRKADVNCRTGSQGRGLWGQLFELS